MPPALTPSTSTSQPRCARCSVACTMGGYPADSCTARRGCDGPAPSWRAASIGSPHYALAPLSSEWTVLTALHMPLVGPQRPPAKGTSELTNPAGRLDAQDALGSFVTVERLRSIRPAVASNGADSHGLHCWGQGQDIGQRSNSHKSPIVKHRDSITVSNALPTMCDDNQRTRPTQPIDRVHNLSLPSADPGTKLPHLGQPPQGHGRERARWPHVDVGRQISDAALAHAKCPAQRAKSAHAQPVVRPPTPTRLADR